MSDPIDLDAIARCVVHCVLAEKGLVEHEIACPARPSVPEVHVAMKATSATFPSAPKNRSGRELVTADSLAALKPGASLEVPDGAVVTPLAEEEARRCGVRLVRPGDDRARIAIGCDHGGFALK